MSNTSADKRTTHTDALDTLGMMHTQFEKRDAIHLAVIQVRATEHLSIGQNISAVDGAAFADEDGLGIVDPFLERNPQPGDLFWMVIRPRLIHSLRHVWSHPAFDDEPEVERIDITDIELPREQASA